jgi:hypothetical protein
VNRQTKRIGVILALVAMVSFGAWPFWKYFYVTNADGTLRNRAQELAEKNAQLQLAWKIAMQDDVLTHDEAEAIIEAAGENAEPGK